ncbi:4Fe-4S dicluster domain-containing protein [Wansuia hejianensis]|uniref:4Fe-4S dicluster domain-containing protein n=1 Tax=Wansuia hejianensis TaxID=2763667 RepID=UPI002ED04FE9
MDVKKKIRKKASIIKNKCVACGTCLDVCPKNAIKIVEGVFAEVDEDKCIGCSICSKECPPSIIEMVAKEEVF